MGNGLKTIDSVGNLKIENSLGPISWDTCCSVKLSTPHRRSSDQLTVCLPIEDDKIDLRVQVLDLSNLPLLRKRLCTWMRSKLRQSFSPKVSGVLDKVEATAVDDQYFCKLLSESQTNAISVQNLFRILYVSSNFDKRFLEVEFGINDRPMDIQTMISSEKWLGGLPLLVPIKHIMHHFPDHFVRDAREGYVFFSFAWPHVLDMLASFFMVHFEEPDKIINSFPWDSLRLAVTSSYLAYAHAWKTATKDQGDAVDMLLGLKEELPGDRIQPGDTRSLEGLLEIASKANKKMMELIGGTWKQTGPTMYESVQLPKDFPECQVTCPGIKSIGRARQKADDKYAEKFGEDRYRRLRDLARMGFVFFNIRGMWNGLAKIREMMRVVAVENRFKSPTNIGWRDVTLLAEVDVGEGVAHIAELQLHLHPLAEVREEEHKQYEFVRAQLSGELAKHSDKVINDILKTLEVQAPPNLQQPITAQNGVLKVYFRRDNGTALTVGERHEFAWSPSLTSLELHGLLASGSTGSAKSYFFRCMDEGQKCKPLVGFELDLLTSLRETLFDDHGQIKVEGACFLREAGAPPRCTSREVPRHLSDALPMYLKTSGPLAAADNLQFFADAISLDDLKDRVIERSPTNVGGSDASAFWHHMEWSKPPDRGIFFLLQGVQSSLVHHIWSCADKPPKCDDGRFFKEANTEGFSVTLRELVQDADCSFGLCVMLRLLGGN